MVLPGKFCITPYYQQYDSANALIWFFDTVCNTSEYKVDLKYLELHLAAYFLSVISIEEDKL